MPHYMLYPSQVPDFLVTITQCGFNPRTDYRQYKRMHSYSNPGEFMMILNHGTLEIAPYLEYIQHLQWNELTCVCSNICPNLWGNCTVPATISHQDLDGCCLVTSLATPQPFTAMNKLFRDDLINLTIIASKLGIFDQLSDFQLDHELFCHFIVCQHN